MRGQCSEQARPYSRFAGGDPAVDRGVGAVRSFAARTAVPSGPAARAAQSYVFCAVPAQGHPYPSGSSSQSSIHLSPARGKSVVAGPRA
jgi:hypothetical protein